MGGQTQLGVGYKKQEVINTNIFTLNTVLLMAPGLVDPALLPEENVSVSSTAVCYVNGKRHVLPEARGDTTLLQWLRGENQNAGIPSGSSGV